MDIREMERRAALLEPRDPRGDLAELMVREGRAWAELNERIRRGGDPVAAGETQNYHETRAPYHATADMAAVTLLTTSVNVVPLATIPGSAFTTAAGYWDLGKKIEIVLFGKFTTVLTPGNLTIEIRYQTGATTEAGGTILATSPAVALTASKTNISWWLTAQIEARGLPSTASPLFAWGKFMSDQAGLLIPAANNPMLIPASAAASVNVDTTLAGAVTIQMKRSGSTVETVTVQDPQVNSLT